MFRKKILEVDNLNLYYKNVFDTVQILYDVNFGLYENEILGVVGESGSGKSQTVLAIMRLFGKYAKISGDIMYNGVNLLKLSEREINKYRGKEISIAFQDSMSALNPYLTIKEQLIEPLIVHCCKSEKEATQEAIRILEIVKIPDAKNKINSYPHECSGGMRQRIMMAMALICHPKIFIADEITTALDVITQLKVIKFLKDLQKEFNMSVIFITHDLRLLAQIADRVLVMYCGHVMEDLKTDDLFSKAMHPYTKALLDSIPNVDTNMKELKSIGGEIPQINNIPKGCPFSTRCSIKNEQCKKEKPQILDFDEHRVACFNNTKI